jgi:hypothetical protein
MFFVLWGSNILLWLVGISLFFSDKEYQNLSIIIFVLSALQFVVIIAYYYGKKSKSTGSKWDCLTFTPDCTPDCDGPDCDCSL